MKLGDRVILPAYPGGAEALVVEIDVPTHDALGGRTVLRSPATLCGRVLVGVQLRGSGKASVVMVEREDLRLAPCPACGRSS